MAGEFVLWNISTQEKNTFINFFPGTRWTDLHHANQGWNVETRAALNRVRDGRGGLENRNSLPPHRYLEIPAITNMTARQNNYLWDCYWINDLQRPSDRGFGAKALCDEARLTWELGRKMESLVAQIRHGTTSIEIYYLSHKEMV